MSLFRRPFFGAFLCPNVYFLSGRMVRGGGRHTDGSRLIGSELQVLGKYIGEYIYIYYYYYLLLLLLLYHHHHY